MEELLAGIGRKLTEEDSETAVCIVENEEHYLEPDVFGGEPPTGLPPGHVRLKFPYTGRTKVIPAAELDDFLLKHGGACINLAQKAESRKF